MSQILSISLPIKHLEGLRKYYEHELGQSLSLSETEKHAKEDAKLFLIERADEGHELPDR